MKPLPPTLRENRRYLLLRITPATLKADERELYFAVSDAVTALFGDTIGAEVHTATIVREGEYLILRCRRGREDTLCTAIATIRSVNGTPVHLTTISTSGTIKALRRGIRGEKKGDSIICTINEAERTGILYADEKIDLIRRDMKGQDVVFLTKDDMEIFHATTTITDGI